MEGNPMMSIICRKLAEEDPNFLNIKMEFESCYGCLKYVVDDIKRDVDKAARDLGLNKQKLDMILKVEPDVEDSQFGKQIGKFIIDCDPKVERIQKLMD
jgi:hypothetical protein